VDALANLSGCATAPESQVFPDLPKAVLAVQSGQADALLGPAISGSLAAQQPGAGVEAAGDVDKKYIMGIAVGKEDSGLRDAILAAVNELIQNGTYDTLLEKYGLQVGAVEEATVNGVA